MPERSRKLWAEETLIYTYLQLAFEDKHVEILPQDIRARLTDRGAVFIVQPKPREAIGVRLWIS